MRLRELQRSLQDLLRSQEIEETSDPELAAYLQTVRASDRLRVVAWTIASWRAFDLGRCCPLTSLALKATGLFEQAVEQSVRRASSSAFVEHLADDFLIAMSSVDEPLVASVARFERAYSAVIRGSNRRFTVSWDRDPLRTFQALLSGGSENVPSPGGTYTILVDRKLPCFFVVTDQNRAEPGPPPNRS